MKMEKLEKQELSLVELENVIAGISRGNYGLDVEYTGQPYGHGCFRNGLESFCNGLESFCNGLEGFGKGLKEFYTGVTASYSSGVVASFYNGLHKATGMSAETRDTLTVATKIIGFVAVAAPTTVFLCVKRIPQRLWRKFSNWLDK